jgi:hypothetical protein
LEEIAWLRHKMGLTGAKDGHREKRDVQVRGVVAVGGRDCDLLGDVRPKVDIVRLLFDYGDAGVCVRAAV